MKILISPAKTVKEGSAPYAKLPAFQKEGNRILSELSKKKTEELMDVWQCSEKIAQLNLRRFESTDILMPAILRYTGLQYKNLSFETLNEKAKNYLNEHVRILSSLYGILRPQDGIPANRLDFHSQLKVEDKDLYAYWNNRPYSEIKDPEIINLASSEYSELITPHLSESDYMTDIVFLNEKGKAQSTLVKQARGKFLRWLCENEITEVEKMKLFEEDNFVYSNDLSDDSHLVFVKSSLQKQ